MACREYELIQDILAFSKSAGTLYDKLADLEYHNLIGSKEYYECIDLLREIRKCEDKRWKDIKFNTEFFQGQMSLMMQMYKLQLQDLLFALSIMENDFPQRRFISFAETYAAKRNETLCACEFTNEEMEEYKKQLEEEYGCEVELISPSEGGYEDLDELIDPTDLAEEKERNEVEIIRDEALSHTYLYYLQEAIKNAKDEETKKYLLKAKYRTIGVNDALEKYFLDRAPQFLMPKLFQRCVEADINRRRNAYEQVYIDFLRGDIEESIRELDSIDYTDLPLEQGGGYALLESIYTKACNSINPSCELDNELQVLKQNALKSSKTDYAKQKILDCFRVNKELSITKNVDL